MNPPRLLYRLNVFSGSAGGRWGVGVELEHWEGGRAARPAADSFLWGRVEEQGTRQLVSVLLSLSPVRPP